MSKLIQVKHVEMTAEEIEAAEKAGYHIDPLYSSFLWS